jgi:hypothetical protein
MEPRTLAAIAKEIRATWLTKDGKPNVNYAAKPYLDAMEHLVTVNDTYGYDDGRYIVMYFLSNARSFTGPAARRIKAELKDML